MGRGNWLAAPPRAIKIHVDGQEIGDGGFTNWTAQFGNDAKERCFTSCVSTERLTELAAPAPGDRNPTGA